MFLFFFFFFKQKTAYEIYQCDWSSDVCSSDLEHLKKIDLFGEYSHKFIKALTVLCILPGLNLIQIIMKKSIKRLYLQSAKLCIVPMIFDNIMNHVCISER